MQHEAFGRGEPERESKSEGFPCCHTSHDAWQADGWGPLHEIKCETIKWHVIARGGRFTLQDLHQHFLWLPSRWLSTPWSHLNKPNFESKTLPVVLSSLIRGMVNPTPAASRGHKYSLKVSAPLSHTLLPSQEWFLSFVQCSKVSGQGEMMPSSTSCPLEV